ncbi:cytochrome P450 [Crucibulum laeve]|uniref:Cytochrome P450 n=1 Tax=Crucibulum laeve TaxID=68775 RepID=A0A5C3M9Y6_9AGAR|nr:cytochrome P450 [Crucibulum laeve]
MHIYRRQTVKHPPGPKPFPLIGNAFQIPNNRQWLVWNQWKAKFGQIILKSPPICGILGMIYSDRPRSVMAGELVGWNKGLGYAAGPPSPRFKELRRLFSSFIGPRPCAGPELQEVQKNENLKLLGKLLEDPLHFLDHTRNSTSSLILKLSYGYEIQRGDPLQLVQIVEDAMDGFSRASEPGWWVDEFPFLRFITWLPFHKYAAVMKSNLDLLYDIPFSFVKKERARGAARLSFISSYLDERKGQETPEDEELINAAAASLYSGNAMLNEFLPSTEQTFTVSSLNSFILAMTLNPAIEARAQSEIDDYMASLHETRLPTIKDKESLSYVSALVKEVWRWNPSVPLGLPHVVTQDDVYRGYTIEKGSIVWANIWSILHDESIFPEPSKFSPERYLEGDVEHPNVEENRASPAEVAESAFGYGRRICPGLYLAKNSIFLSIATILYVFSISKALDENGNEVTPDVQYDGFISHPRPFKCKIEPRSKAREDLVRSSLEHSKE